MAWTGGLRWRRAACSLPASSIRPLQPRGRGGRGGAGSGPYSHLGRGKRVKRDGEEFVSGMYIDCAAPT